MSGTKNYILDAAVAGKKLRRMALEIIENNAGEEQLILVGIKESGSVVARNIQQLIAEYSEVRTELLMITLDKKMPKEVSLNKTMNFDDKVIIVIDDVANSGKTILYALKPFLEYQPRKIETAVLVGRSHNSFPVQTDYVGISIATTLQDHIYVEVQGEQVVGAYLK